MQREESSAAYKSISLCTPDQTVRKKYTASNLDSFPIKCILEEVHFPKVELQLETVDC